MNVTTRASNMHRHRTLVVFLDILKIFRNLNMSFSTIRNYLTLHASLHEQEIVKNCRFQIIIVFL